MYCSILGTLCTEHPSQHALLSTPQENFMRTPSLQVTKIHWRLPFQLSTRANKSDLLVPFHKKGGPLQAQIADKHVHGTSQGFLFALKACLQGRSESQQLPGKFTRISRNAWQAPSFFLTYGAHGVLLCPGCLFCVKPLGCEWSLLVDLFIFDARNFILTLQTHLPT